MSNAQIQQDVADLKAAETAVDQTFETSSDWIAAQAAVKQAQSDYADACGPVIAGLKSQPDYLAAVDAQNKADSDLKDQQNEGSTDQISDAAQTAMAARSAVKVLENKAIATDASTVAARQKVVAAEAAFGQLKAKERAAVLADPTWQAAKKKLDADRNQG